MSPCKEEQNKRPVRNIPVQEESHLPVLLKVVSDCSYDFNFLIWKI